MKIALAAVGFYDRDIEYNKNKILNCMKENREKTDLKHWTGSMKQTFIWQSLFLTGE